MDIYRQRTRDPEGLGYTDEEKVVDQTTAVYRQKER